MCQLIWALLTHISAKKSLRALKHYKETDSSNAKMNISRKIEKEAEVIAVLI